MIKVKISENRNLDIPLPIKNEISNDAELHDYCAQYLQRKRIVYNWFKIVT